MLNIKNKFHGFTSLAIIDLATIIAIYAIATESILWSALYTIYVFAAIGTIIYVYCRKCTSRNDCSHIFIGPITRLMPKAKTNTYSNYDYIIVGILIALMLGLPQIWLLKLHTLTFIYWSLIVIAGIQIKFYVCSKCNNTACAMCKKQLIINSKK